MIGWSSNGARVGRCAGEVGHRAPSLDQAKDRKKERTDCYFRKQATAEKPIVFRPAGDGDVIPE